LRLFTGRRRQATSLEVVKNFCAHYRLCSEWPLFIICYCACQHTFLPVHMPQYGPRANVRISSSVFAPLEEVRKGKNRRRDHLTTRQYH
jgi:hypothetical protein